MGVQTIALDAEKGKHDFSRCSREVCECISCERASGLELQPVEFPSPTCTQHKETFYVVFWVQAWTAETGTQDLIAHGRAWVSIAGGTVERISSNSTEASITQNPTSKKVVRARPFRMT